MILNPDCHIFNVAIASIHKDFFFYPSYIQTNKKKSNNKKNNTISDIKLKYRSIYRVQKKVK